MAKYGLVGKNIAYSFSKTFFSIKFEKEKRDDTYSNYDIKNIDALDKILAENPTLKGFNVTIPYKEVIIKKLDILHEEAKIINAVNTVKILRNGKLKGYNTDHYGFAKALANYLPLKEKRALILGTGGASKAIAFVLETMNFEYKYVSRTKKGGALSYSELNRINMSNHFLIINCTPLGTHPNVHEYPPIPYEFITKHHVLFDLIYNPRETEFLKRGFAKGAKVSNGLKMLEHQAKKSWSIWKR